MEEVQETSLWKKYQDGMTYMQQLGIATEYPRCVKFYEGEQWPAATKATRNLPRPVINLTKMIVRNKKAAILGSRARIVYKAPGEEDTDRIRRFNEFADYMTSEIGQDRLDKQAIKDGAIKGTYIYHYYWDAEAVGADGKEEGGLRCELLNPLNVIFANPAEQDEQKQAWIMFASRQPVEAVRERADKGVDPDDIVPDEGEGTENLAHGDLPDSEYEQDTARLVTVLTRYFRKDGEVYWERATKKTLINEARPLAPDVEAARAEIKREMGTDAEGAAGTPDANIDAPNTTMMDGHNARPMITEERTRAYLYPIVVGQYETREGSIYGIGEVRDIIPNQKAINFLTAMMILNAQEMAWGKYVVDPMALRKQTITNAPGQVLVDYSKTGNGIKQLPANALNGQPMQIVDALTTLTRSVTGSTEVMNGETMGASMSGAAIAELQSQAMLPIDDLRENFWLVKEKQGKVLAQAFVLYYAGKTYYTEQTGADETGEEYPAQIENTFDGADYYGLHFDVVAEAVTGTKASAAGDITLLQYLVEKQYIDATTFVQLYPDEAITNKTELVKAVTSGQNQILAQQTAQIEQLTARVQEDAKTIEAAQKITNENAKMRSILTQLYEAATAQIEAANKEIAVGNAALQRTTEDAREMAMALMDILTESGEPGSKGIKPDKA